MKLRIISAIFFVIFIIFLKINCLEYKPFVIIIPSYNNINYCIKNLESVFMQNYSNYRIIYIDDCSTDGTANYVKDFIAKLGQENRTLIITNKERRGAMANHYYAAHLCEPHEIIVHLDGDDFLDNNQVLDYLNKIYNNPEVWLTYGQYKVLSKKNIKSCCTLLPQWVINKHCYRNYPFVTSHLRTFYACLFHKIKLKDFFYKGKFFAASCDVGFMMPLLEMCYYHSKFIDKILYNYNALNPIMDYKTNKTMLDLTSYYIRDKKKYSRLKNLPLNINQESNSKTADYIIYFSGDLNKLYKLLDQIKYKTCDYNNIFIFAEKNKIELNNKIKIINQDLNNLKSFLNSSSSDYIILITSSSNINSYIDISQCIKDLERTHAHAFFFYLYNNYCSKNFLNLINYNILAWQFKYSQLEFKYPNFWSGSLIKKKSLIKLLNLNISLKDLSLALSSKFFKNKIALCFNQNKIDSN